MPLLLWRTCSRVTNTPQKQCVLHVCTQQRQCCNLFMVYSTPCPGGLYCKLYLTGLYRFLELSTFLTAYPTKEPPPPAPPCFSTLCTTGAFLVLQGNPIPKLSDYSASPLLQEPCGGQTAAITTHEIHLETPLNTPPPPTFPPHPPYIQVLSWYPRVILFPNFLSKAQAHHFRSLAEGKMQPSPLMKFTLKPY
jgi:hypothetical protein